jgi:uncharacterized SAM-binding protein YcdF (DUF218 family)
VPIGPIIVVLGCRVEADGTPSPALLRRAAWARAAFEADVGDTIVASGGRPWHGHVEADAVSTYLVARGVPREHILRELASLTTAENAFFTAEIMRSLGARRAVVVTCSWHMPRALRCFRAVGIQATPLHAPAPPSGPLRAIRRAIREALSDRLDAFNLRRIAALRERGALHPFEEPT